MADEKPVEVGLIDASGSSRELADRLAEEVRESLRECCPGVEWRVASAEADDAVRARSGGELMEAARRRLLRENWRMVVCLTGLPLRASRRPVIAHASATEGVGVLSLPALGAVNLERRARDAVARLVEGVATDGAIDLGSPLGEAQVRDDGTIRLAAAVVRGNLRLLAGMVRANDPSRVIARLSRALAAAVGTGAFALASSNIWNLADGMSWPRLVGLSLLAIVATCLALIVAHKLWERPARPEERERIMLFNLATATTILLGVVVLYLALLAISLACAGALIPLGVFDRELGHAVGFGDYLKLASLATSLGTIGGGLGSVVESDLAVREAIYRGRAGEQAERAGDDER
ncbi:MAG: hypothetical protein QOE65_2878 [Solirubrobacteraceae bacterium]|jgi:hypothetical protein|nr:hypothetical protein [Solirubrobacteraceae bacterium]